MCLRDIRKLDMNRNRVEGYEVNIRVVRSDPFHVKVELPGHDDQRSARLSEMSEICLGIDERLQPLDVQLALCSISTYDHEIVETEVTGCTRTIRAGSPLKCRDENANDDGSEENAASCQSP